MFYFDELLIRTNFKCIKSWNWLCSFRKIHFTFDCFFACFRRREILWNFEFHIRQNFEFQFIFSHSWRFASFVVISNEDGKFITKFEFSTKFQFLLFSSLPFVESVDIVLMKIMKIFWCFNELELEQFEARSILCKWAPKTLCLRRASIKLIIFKLLLTVISSCIVRELTPRYLNPDYVQNQKYLNSSLENSNWNLPSWRKRNQKRKQNNTRFWNAFCRLDRSFATSKFLIQMWISDNRIFMHD